MHISGGNMYASINDLSTFGRAILSSQLIKPALTRRWLKPVSYSADPAASVGAPWGLRRIQLQPATQPFRALTAFVKSGTFQDYSSFITLIPQYNIGFTVMLAGRGPLSNFEIADFMGAALIPAYDTAARNEAGLVYAGTYVSAEIGPTGTALNTSIIITTDPAKPGLGIVSWISNGTNMIDLAVKVQSGSNVTPHNAEVRLYYTQLESEAANGGKEQSWKAVFEDTGIPWVDGGLFSTACGAWVGITGVTYGSLPLDEFIFNFDAASRVVSITNLALRSTLYKIS
jgi:hypothetical protein